MHHAMSQVFFDSLVYYSKAKSTSYALQYWTLNKIASAIGLKTPFSDYDSSLISALTREADRLIRSDINHMRAGDYPPSVLKPDPALDIVRTVPKVIADLLSIAKRRSQGKTVDFTSDAESFLEDLPTYYKQNFHFQTDGYLSQQSASVYEYEVDLLFSGLSDAMRRLIIAPMKAHFGPGEGKGLRFLELGAGTGRSTRFVKMAFPQASIVLVDLSDPYLKIAQKNLANFSKISFLQADGAQLPFKKGEFDAVYSVFLFHELPEKIRIKVLNESFRVLRSEGFFGLVDSIQKGDKPKFDVLLDEFPKDFHEPFYRNYIHTPMEDLIQSLTASTCNIADGFFSKVVSTTKTQI